MSKRPSRQPQGPSQRQLRAGELIRHALVDVLAREHLREPALEGVSVTVSEVRPSPDLRHAAVFCAPLGAGDTEAIVTALNRCAPFLRGRLGREITLKFTPQLHFIADQSFDEASRVDRLLADPKVVQDLAKPAEEG